MRLLLVLIAATLTTTAPLMAQAVSREEALAAVYPGASIRAEQVFLTTTQMQQAATRAGEAIPSALVARYLAVKGTDVIGRAYVDTHTVRTKRESLLIALGADGRVARIEVTAFLEPPEYRAPDIWLRQYRGRALESDLTVNRAIRPLAGATLTGRATNAAVRRVLAIDAVLSTGSTR
jgi:uncharacterized glyoxalase superfamily metalloenzyme YdcJ